MRVTEVKVTNADGMALMSNYGKNLQIVLRTELSVVSTSTLWIHKSRDTDASDPVVFFFYLTQLVLPIWEWYLSQTVKSIKASLRTAPII